MSRAYSPEDARKVMDAFSRLSTEEKQNLVEGLAKDGINQNGVLLYYSPAFIQNAINADKNNEIEMLTKAYSVMSKIYANNNDIDSQEKVQIISMANVANAIRTNPELSAEELYKLL